MKQFRRTLDIPLINCQLNLILTWSENCVITNRARREKIFGTDNDQNPHFLELNNPTNVTFKLTDTKLYVPVVTLSTKNDKKLLEQDLKELLNGINVGQK